jgi:hypothetical protein
MSRPDRHTLRLMLALTHSTLSPYVAIPIVVVVLGARFAARRRRR